MRHASRGLCQCYHASMVFAQDTEHGHWPVVLATQKTLQHSKRESIRLKRSDAVILRQSNSSSATDYDAISHKSLTPQLQGRKKNLGAE